MSLNKHVKILNEQQGQAMAKIYQKICFPGSTGGQAFHKSKPSVPNEVIPKIYADDPRFLRLMENIDEKVRITFEEDILENGFYGKSAFNGNVSNLRTVSGVKASPGSYPLVGNTKWRSDQGLFDRFMSKDDEEIFEELITTRYSHYDESALTQISELSSSGMPLNTYDPEAKLGFAMNMANNAEEIMRMTVNGEFEKLYDKHKIIYASTETERTQNTDSIIVNKDGSIKTKDRYVNDYEYAITQGQSGKRSIASKKVIIDGVEIKGHSAMRLRNPQAFSIGATYISKMGLEGIRTGADKEYEATYKVRQRSDLEEQSNQWNYCIPLDVTQYDASIPYFLFEAWVKYLPISDLAKEYLLVTSRAPVFFRQIEGKSNPILTGDIFDLEYYCQWMGLQSGTAFTSMLGKDLFSFQLLILINDYFKNVKGNVAKILRWESHDAAFKNTGDDSLLYSNNAAFYQFTIDNILNDKAAYFKIDLENGARYLGNILYSSDNRIKVCGDINSFLSNMFVPERTIGMFDRWGQRLNRENKIRKYPIFGMLTRVSMFSDNPSFDAINEILQREWFDIFKTPFWDYLREYEVKPKEFNGRVLSAAEIEVMLDPSKLMYKYTNKDIGSDLADTIQKSIPAEFQRKVESIYLRS